MDNKTRQAKHRAKLARYKTRMMEIRDIMNEAANKSMQYETNIAQEIGLMQALRIKELADRD